MKNRLYIIAGCNGAGKTTAAMSLLPNFLMVKEFVNADEIAKGLSPLNPEGVAIEAGRLMLMRIAGLMEQGKSFALETTLSTRSYVNLVRKAHQLNYMVYLVFFWLESAELAVARVAERVKSGGHNIPTEVIHRRYHKGISNLFNLFVKEVDAWAVFDNSDVRPKLIADGAMGEYEVIDTDKYNKMISYVR